MAVESCVYEAAEFLRIVVEQSGALLEGKAGRAIATFVYGMAGCLVAEEFDLLVVVHCILEKVYDVAVVCD